MVNETEIERARTVKARHENDLLGKANVVAVGIGLGESSPHLKNRVCIIVSVRREVPEDKLSRQDIIPNEIEASNIIYVSPNLIRRYQLRRGDTVTGHAQPLENKWAEVPYTMDRVDLVNGAVATAVL